MAIRTWFKTLVINLNEINVMKKLFLFISLPLLLASCIKQLDKKFSGTPVAEIDATPLHSPATGVTYPVMTRVPGLARPVITTGATADSTLRRFSGTVRIRVNLVGPQSNEDETVGYKVFTGPPSPTIAFPATVATNGQFPTAPAATLSLLDAVPGTHYNQLPGIVTIPANSSFGFIDVVIRNNGPTAGQARFIGIQLDSTGTLLPNPNYNKIALAIDQR
jgi:hypothetical protein